MGNLRVLYASNNSISSWEEIDRLAGLEHLQDVLFVGNPLHARYHAKGVGAAANGPATYIREMQAARAPQETRRQAAGRRQY